MSEKYTTREGCPSPWNVSPKAKESVEDHRGSYEDLLQTVMANKI